MEILALALTIALLALQAIDVHSTNRVLALGGGEGNAYVRAVMGWLGKWWPLVKVQVVAGVALAWAYVPQPWLSAGLAVACLGYGYVAARNYRIAGRLARLRFS